MNGREAHRRQGLTAPSTVLMRLFRVYLAWYLPRHFHAVRLRRGTRLPDAARPVVVYLNHAAWWDPLICMTLARRLFPDRKHSAPMDAAALARYPMLGRMGFFPVEQNTRHGAAEFLRAASAVLQAPSATLWLTPQGAFTDARQRPVAFKGGLAALLKLNPQAVALPMAIEYTFWDERLPEVLIQAGTAPYFDSSASREAVNDVLAHALTVAQDELAALAIARNPAAFDTLMSGQAGVGFVYDALRRLRALFGGEAYRAEHGGPMEGPAERARFEDSGAGKEADLGSGARLP